MYIIFRNSIPSIILHIGSPLFRYVQLMEKDVLKFGFSSREYVMLHDQSKEEQEEDPGLE